MRPRQNRQQYKNASRVMRTAWRFFWLRTSWDPKVWALFRQLSDLRREVSEGLLSADEAARLGQPVRDRLLRHPDGDRR
jgi:hypothetical protein